MMFALVPMTALAAEDATFEVIDTEGNTTQFTKIQDARKAMKDGYTLKLLKIMFRHQIIILEYP